MKITFEEFQKQSRRTMPYGGKPASLQEQNDILLNYSLGIVGEALELEAAVTAYDDARHDDEAIEAAVLSEMGDVLHYASGLCDLHGIEMGSTPDKESPDKTPMIHLAGGIAEYTKKHVFHGHEQPFPSDSLKDIVLILEGYSYEIGTTIGEVMAMNIQKLKTRFPEGFNTQDSVARVDVEQAGTL